MERFLHSYSIKRNLKKLFETPTNCTSMFITILLFWNVLYKYFYLSNLFLPWDISEPLRSSVLINIFIRNSGDLAEDLLLFILAYELYKRIIESDRFVIQVWVYRIFFTFAPIYFILIFFTTKVKVFSATFLSNLFFWNDYFPSDLQPISEGYLVAIAIKVSFILLMIYTLAQKYTKTKTGHLDLLMFCSSSCLIILYLVTIKTNIFPTLSPIRQEDAGIYKFKSKNEFFVEKYDEFNLVDIWLIRGMHTRIAHCILGAVFAQLSTIPKFVRYFRNRKYLTFILNVLVTYMLSSVLLLRNFTWPGSLTKGSEIDGWVWWVGHLYCFHRFFIVACFGWFLFQAWNQIGLVAFCLKWFYKWKIWNFFKELAYPMFLIHSTAIFMYLLVRGFEKNNIKLIISLSKYLENMFVCFIFILTSSFFLYMIIQRPMVNMLEESLSNLKTNLLKQKQRSDLKEEREKKANKKKANSSNLNKIIKSKSKKGKSRTIKERKNNSRKKK
ncbi:o-acyltransferase [Anaeramoeba flamelloides]|uniref:O-acyltransferase n=1 Tax=Anaeramoeba flamelloides TaxID=1746091 RepID=A0AAV8A2X1_9EUKA|nr:o-acyltransferase [Anaeramoeba flamelloides]